MSLASPLMLLTLLVPAGGALALFLLRRRAPRYTVPFTNLGVLAAVASRSRPWRRTLTTALVLASLASLCVGLARPSVSLATPYERASVVLVVDVSGSMQAEDIAPTRLDAAREAMERFLDRLPRQIRAGLVAFSNTADVIAVPTTDRERVKQSLQTLFADSGTAIGDGVARGAQLARSAIADETGAVPPRKKGDPSPATVLFLSDGSQSRGVLTPDEGAEVARKAGVPVYTVALGTDEGVIEITRFGERRVIPVPPDRATLARIAELTGGKSYDVRDADRLREVYETLGRSLGRVERPHEVTVAFVGLGAGLLTAAGLLAGLWSPRLP